MKRLGGCVPGGTARTEPSLDLIRRPECAPTPFRGRGDFARAPKLVLVAVVGVCGTFGCGDDTEAPDATAAPDASSGVDAGVDAGPDAGPSCPALVRQRIASDLDFPILTASPRGDDRIFLVEQLAGTVRVIDGTGALSPEPFLRVSEELSIDGFEAGLLSFTFHPDYPAKASVFVGYTTTGGMLRVSRLEVSPDDPDHVVPQSESIVIEIPTPVHHNVAGGLAFGPDGFLYIAMGDTNDASLGQKLDALAAKILRIDIEPEDDAVPYEVPADNPFVGVEGAREEVWVLGLREPFRFSFDPVTYDLYIADVGELRWEEVNILGANQGRGTNFGWVTMEGPDCQDPPEGCNPEGLTLPTYSYGHEEGAAVIGGVVYRGSALSDCWQGRYFFSDYPTGWIRSFRWSEAAGVEDVQEHAALLDGVVLSFAVDGDGEILIVGTSTLDRIVPGHGNP